MFCTKCGKEITNDTAKYCPRCGGEIFKTIEVISNKMEESKDTIDKNKNTNTIEELEDLKSSSEHHEKILSGDKCDSSKEIKYLFFKNINGEKRERINKKLNYGNKIAEIIIAFLTIYFIYEQIELAENYKLIIYFIRYIIFILPFVFFATVYEEVYKLFSIEENKKNKLLGSKTIIAKIIYLLLLFAIMQRLTDPTGDTIGLLRIVVEDNFILAFLGYLSVIKFELLSLVILGACNYFYDKNLLGYKEPVESSFFE